MSWKHFKLREFECRCGCGGNEIDHRLIDVLDLGREELGFPLVISSGYRCPVHNDKVSGTGRNGPHTTGKAIDVLISGKQAWAFLQWAFEIEFSGIGINQRGDFKKRFIHVDFCEEGHRRPTIWSY